VPKVPEVPGIARIVAIANQKGGVGKSTTAVSLGAALADIGYRVLVVDLDPQGNASTGMGIRHEAREITVYDVVVAEAPLEDAIVPTPVPRLHAIPSTIDLAGAEIELVSQFSRETRLKRALNAVRQGHYDFVFLDCPPSLGLLTINALTAAEELIVPIQCEYYALEGVGQLLRNVSLVQQNINPDLRLSGIVMTMYDPRTKLSEQVVEEVQRFFGDLVYDVIIPRTVRLSEAPGYGQPITVYDPKSKGAECYRELAREVALRPPPEAPIPTFEGLPTVVLPAQVPGDAVTRGPLEDSALDEMPTVHELVEAEEAQHRVAGAELVEDELETEAVQDEVAEAVGSAVDTMETEEGHDLEPVPESGPESEPESEPEPELEPASPPRSERRELSPRVVDDEIWEEADAEAESRVRAPHDETVPGQLPGRRVVVIDDDSDLDIKAGQEPLVRRPQRGEPAPEGSDEAAIGATLREDGEKRRWRLFRKGGE
jgi:chromosome partitioning protein